MKFGKVQEKAATVAESTRDPQAYIFLGRDKFRSDERSPQEWRKLFLSLAGLAQHDNGTEMSQNEFGLSIVYDALVKLETVARKALGADFEETMDAAWKKVEKREAERASTRAKRAAADAAAVGEVTSKKTK